MDIAALSRDSFARFDLNRVPSPCFVVDEAAIERNLSILADVADQSGANILLALKAFSMFALTPLVDKYLSGTCASGLYEARLGRQKFAGTVTTYCAGFKAQDLDEIIRLSDHLIFNTPSQHQRFAGQVQAARDAGATISLGLRINPEHSEGWNPKYDPAAQCSRLGTPISKVCAADLKGVDGLHMHTLCEQGFAPLQRTWDAVEDQLGPWLKEMKWLNLGGGHHITQPDYDRAGLIALVKHIKQTYDIDVYLEPGEACALHAGILVGEVLDVTENDMPLAIVDISATCHMPDVIEAPYRPDLLGEVTDGVTYRLGGPSCLAGDVIGDYTPARPLAPGDRIAFLDQAHYSMVKTNTFNGVPLPAIALWNSDTDDLRMIREFTYDDFVERLS
ncbi:carboxynorspermidine decarboxylase [Loktanella sp. D2R18]|uniref:carboxynorspermidine decarboxylase n=1 Tax=Rhodobacterales TaxID=204455 RepID=UPI000DEA8115|nr:MULTISPECIES: carboxynorspermidine decarboxylase [Rhodobacterales]MDO6592185.1 carboxynorspermidine decarboxylase [Yoonia sp. 1_MG-2023]RBW43418.1 carboxynorspermidine decarboxylase [Loktanella sp. D2R18]